MSSRNSNKSSWAVRRRFMFVAAGFCMLIIFFVLWTELDTAPAEAAVTMAFVTLGGIVGGYVFGAAWEDISMARLKA